MSIEVPIDELFDEVGRWGFGYLITVSDGDRSHLLALRPTVLGAGGERVMRFDAGGGGACRNAAVRPNVSVPYPVSWPLSKLAWLWSMSTW